MGPMTENQVKARKIREVTILVPLGFERTASGTWIKDNVEYDLSAADLTQMHRIIAEGLFVCKRA